jgi:hypothetical protein
MKGFTKAFLGLMLLAATGLTLSPLASVSALAADATPATTATKTAPAKKKAPAKKVAKKKAVKKHGRVARKSGAGIVGVIRDMDMNAQPMTLVVVKDAGKKDEFVFGGDITSKTAIYKGKKKVGMSALQAGQKVSVSYRRFHGSLLITAIHIR